MEGHESTHNGPLINLMGDVVLGEGPTQGHIARGVSSTRKRRPEPANCGLLYPVCCLFFANKVLLEHSTFIHLCVVSGCFHTTMRELSSHSRAHMVQETKNIPWPRRTDKHWPHLEMELREMGGSLGPHGSFLGSLLFGWNLHQWAVLLRRLPLPREMAKHSH